jgi:tRNA threonylcarbamoyladenosine biosynthesis protein TsaE
VSPRRTLRSHTPAETQAIGERLGASLRPGAVVACTGELGAGKTCFLQGLARGLGVTGPVTSPTFVLVNEYHRADSEVLYHVDAFRLATADEARAMGLAELLEESRVVVIEWPAHVVAILPDEHLRVQMSWVDDSRRALRFEAGGQAHLRLLGEFRKAAFGG